MDPDVPRRAYSFLRPTGDGELSLEEDTEQGPSQNPPARGGRRRFRLSQGAVALAGLVSLVIAVAFISGSPGPRQHDGWRHPLGLREFKDCLPYEEDIDYRGLDELRKIEKVHTSQKCRDECEAEDACAAWAWGKMRDVKGISDVCFLKEAKEKQEVQKYPRYGFFAGVRSDTACTMAPVEDRPASVKGHIKVQDGLCLEAWAPEGPGSKVAMGTCKAHNAGQEWTYFEKTGRIRSAGGMCLDAVDRNQPLVRLEMYPCDGGNWSQQWMFDTKTGIVKNWRGKCVEAGERKIDGGMVYIETCDVASLNQRWELGASGKQPPLKHYPVGTLYCFALMIPGSYEEQLLTMQHQRGVSIFACDAYSVYSNTHIEVDGVDTSIVNSTLKCGKGGEFGTALNLDIFIAVWTKVISDAIYLQHDWTIKADPDCVFFPGRLRKVLEFHPEEKVGTYLNNCKFGMHGPLEVFSRNAVTSWAKGTQHCIDFFNKQCGGDCFWGEDLFVDQCLWKVLGVRRDNDFRLLVEDHCEPPKGWDDCRDSTRVAFHPFKAESGYVKCLENAGEPSVQPVTTREPVVRAEHAQRTAAPTRAPERTPEPTRAPEAVRAGPPETVHVRVVAPGPPEAPEPTEAPEPQGRRRPVRTEAPQRAPQRAEAPESVSVHENHPRQPAEHAARSGCHTATGDERCHVAVLWAMNNGFRLHPEWYPGLDKTSTEFDFQAKLHESPYVNCPMPCKS